MRGASVLFVVVTACGGSVAPPPAVAQIDIPESLQYDVALRGMTVGHVVVSIGEPGEVDGRRAVVVRSSAKGGGALSLFSDLDWELETVVALDDTHALSEQEAVDVCPIVGDPIHEKNTRDLAGSDDYNVPSAAEMIRAWHSRRGEDKSFDLRVSDIYLDVKLHDAAREMSAKLPAVRYDGIVRDKYPVSIWISDDAARVPLRMVSASKWGDIAVDLVAYDA